MAAAAAAASSSGRPSNPFVDAAAEGAAAEGEALLEEVKLNEAILLLEAAAQRHPTHASVLRVFGRALVEDGQLERAAAVLGRCVELHPDAHWEPWMNLGQLRAGHDALRCFRKGAELMQGEMKKSSSKGGAAEEGAMATALSDCYCSMAELFTTDLCEEATAEQECERLLQLALETAPTNPGALYAVTNLRLIQGDEKGASDHVDRCMRCLSDLDSLDGVSHDLIANVAKACVELGRLDAAAQMFEVALELDDTDVELWYFTALTYFKLGRKADTLAYVARLEEMLAKAHNPPLSAAVSELAAEAAALPDDADDEEEEEGDGDEEEEDDMEVEPGD